MEGESNRKKKHINAESSDVEHDDRSILPFGFDVIQYWLILATGNLWRANFVLYCLAGLFFGLSILFRLLSKKRHIYTKQSNEKN
jgi:hypothetical protein